MSDQIDIRFFQATATAIPTLVVALTVALRIFEPRADRETKYTIVDGLTSLFFIIFFSTGEIVALLALARGETSKTWAAFPMITIVALLGLIGFESLMPLSRSLGASWTDWFKLVYLLIIAAGMIAAAALL